MSISATEAVRTGFVRHLAGISPEDVNAEYPSEEIAGVCPELPVIRSLVPVSSASSVSEEAAAQVASCWVSSDELTLSQKEMIEDYARRFGSQYDSFLTVNASHRTYFFAENGRGIVSFVRRGRRVGCFGGIMGPQEHWPAIISELISTAKQNQLQLGFFAADVSLTELLKSQGFRANKFGEGAIVDLTQTDWKGRRYEWVRRQTSFCQRQGLEFAECSFSQLSPAEWQQLSGELLEIENQFLSERSHGSRLRHVVGEFAGHLTPSQRLFVARKADTGVIEAFVICNPALNGTRWVLECFRRRPDATRGVISYILHQIMVLLKAEGVAEADLCMVPFVNCEKPLEKDHWLSRKTISFIAKHLNWIYDAQGLYHFKSRFRPDFRDLHVCVYPGINVGWIQYIVAECGFLNIRVGNVVRQIFRHLSKRRERANMAGADH